ncbi:MAG TPA: Vms1/Ankzf1 family peptidyl-tRNA hydrolase, partial [Acidimicrobiales bacterium]|nr:Vms1/Ankzf1 family peptidyl-tRNA hydrolase [Acidimicrobiales bacterium]
METSGVTPGVAVRAPELAELVQAPGPFATIYLTTEGDVENAAFKSEQRWKALRDRLADDGAAEQALAAVDPVVGGAHVHGACLGVVADGAGTVHVEHGPGPLAQDVGRWSPLPSLVPLLEWRQALPPHVVVLADRTGADLYAHRRSGPDLQRQGGGEDDPVAKSSPGGWSQRKFQQRAENTWEHNADDVAEQLVGLVDQVEAKLVVAAGDVRALQLLREALPREMADRLRTVGGGRSEDGSSRAVTHDVHRLVAETVAAETAGLVAKLREELGQQDRAVEGAGPTFEALAMAQVEVLLVHDDLFDERQAWFGPDPTHLALDQDGLRQLGVDQPQPARLADVAVRAALATGAGIRVVAEADAA